MTLFSPHTTLHTSVLEQGRKLWHTYISRTCHQDFFWFSWIWTKALFSGRYTRVWCNTVLNHTGAAGLWNMVAPHSELGRAWLKLEQIAWVFGQTHFTVHIDRLEHQFPCFSQVLNQFWSRNPGHYIIDYIYYNVDRNCKLISTYTLYTIYYILVKLSLFSWYY